MKIMDTDVLDRQAQHLEIAANGVRKSKDIEMFLKTLKYATDIMKKFNPEDLDELRHISETFPDIGRFLQGFVFENVKEDIVVIGASKSFESNDLTFPQFKEIMIKDFVNTVADQPFNINDYMPQNIRKDKEDTKLKHPEYLTTQDVANILGISTQMVRRYCTEGKIDAWRTQGNKGEWRIDIEQYRENPNYIKMVKRRTKNLLMADIVEELSDSEGYHDAIDRIEAEREN